MRHIAIVTLPLSGHLNPMGVLADALKARGHKVTVVGPPGLCDLARAHMPGIPTYSIADSSYPAARLRDFLEALPRVRGLKGIRRVIDEIAALSDLYVRQLPHALEALGADLVLNDQLEPAAGVVARGTGLAHASLACALSLHRDSALPPPLLGWPLRDSPLWRSLYGGGYLVIDRMMAPQGAVLRRAARDFGLEPRALVSDWVSRDCDLSQCIPGFDYDSSTAPDHIGPLRRSDPLTPLDFERDGRDLVFCSLGTIMGGRVDIFDAVARACASNVVQCVIAHGGRLSDSQVAQLEALPGNPVVRDFVDQDSVLSEARATVLHGGFNSVLDALGHGVPMVLLPLAFEQAAIAARVREAGAGIVLRTTRAAGRRVRADRLSASLTDALYHALNDRSLRASALRLARASATAGGTAEAVARIEAAQPLPAHAVARPRGVAASR